MTYQNWTYRVLINSLVSDWQFIESFNSETNINRIEDENEIFSRYKINSITAYRSEDIDLLQTLSLTEYETTIEVYLNDNLQLSGTMELLPDIDENRGHYKYKIQATDIYSDIVDNYDEDFEILNDVVTITGVQGKTINIPLTFKTGTNFSDGIGSLWSSLAGTNIYARQNETVTPERFELIEDIDGWTYVAPVNPNGTYNISRDWTYSNYGTPVISTDWGTYQQFQSAQSRTINNDYIQGMYTHIFEYLAASTYNQVGVDNFAYYPSYTQHTRCLDFISVIKYLIGQVDSSTQFEDAAIPASTDSFYYLKTFTDPDTNTPLSDLHISLISDFILNDDFSETDTPSTKSSITLKKIFDYLKAKYSIYWELENRSGTYYFIFKHYTEVNKITGRNPDLTNHYYINWSSDKKQYEYDRGKIYKRLKRNELASNVDFVGLDVIINEFEVLNTLDLTYSVFFVDLLDMQINRGTYPASSTSQYAMMSTIVEQEITNIFSSDNNFTNTAGLQGFETFSFTQTTQTMAAINIVGNNGIAVQSNISSLPAAFGKIITGDVLEVEYTLIMNSGTNPEIVIDGVTYPLTIGNNTFSTNAMGYLPDTRFIVQANGITATDFSLTFNHVYITRTKVLQSTGAITDLTLSNAALSLANADNNNLSKLPSLDVNINGSNVTLSADNLDKIRNMTDIKAPLMYFDRWFFEDLVITSLGNAELVSIDQKNDNSLATIKLRF